MPENGIIGDSDYDLPSTKVPEDELNEIKNMAKFSQSREFKRLKGYLEARVVFWQSFLPGNTPVNAIAESERGRYWAVADSIIGELRAIIAEYENAQEEVKNARRDVAKTI